MLDTARAHGLRAFGATRRPEAALFGATLFDSASPQLARHVRDASDGGVTAVFDSRAGLGLWRSRAMLRPRGRVVSYGLSSIAQRRGLDAALRLLATFATIGLLKLLPGRRHSIFAIDQVFPRSPDQVRAWVAEALDLLAAESIAPMVESQVPLERVLDAHHRMERGEVVGKVVVDCR